MGLLESLTNNPLSTWLSVGSTVLGGVGAVRDAKAIREQAEQQRKFNQLEVFQEAVFQRREQINIFKEKGRARSRAIAIISATGGSPDDGSDLAVLQAIESEFDLEAKRRNQDSNMRQVLLKERGANTLSAARQAESNSLLSGVGYFAMSAGELLRPSVAPRRAG